MPGQNAVPLIVLSAAREPVEAVNGILRRAGQPVHCTWIPALRDLADALTQLNPEMLVSASARSRSAGIRSEEHTSELQSQSNLVCRLLLEKKKQMMVHTLHLLTSRLA